MQMHVPEHLHNKSIVAASKPSGASLLAHLPPCLDCRPTCCRGNVINPDDIVWQYGADSLRLYEMFMGPLRETKARYACCARRACCQRCTEDLAAPAMRRVPRGERCKVLAKTHKEDRCKPLPAAAAAPRPLQVWSTKGVEGVHRFLARVYRLVAEGVGLSEEEPTRDQLRLLHQTIKKVGRAAQQGGGILEFWVARWPCGCSLRAVLYCLKSP